MSNKSKIIKEPDEQSAKGSHKIQQEQKAKGEVKPAPNAKKTAVKAAPAPVPSKAPTSSNLRTASKQARLIEMLRHPRGATITQIMKATGWQAHTVRGAISGALKTKLGLKVISERKGGAERTYRIKAA